MCGANWATAMVQAKSLLHVYGDLNDLKWLDHLNPLGSAGGASDGYIQCLHAGRTMILSSAHSIIRQ